MKQTQTVPKHPPTKTPRPARVVRDSADSSIGWIFAALLVGSVAAFALLKHPRSASAAAPPPLPPPPATPPPPTPPVVTEPTHAIGAPFKSPYTASSWDTAFQVAGPDLPLAFLRQWTAIESDGNPCAEGHEGYLTETGIAQLMWPDNIQAAGTTIPAMRVGCYGNTMMMSRLLTPAEMLAHVIPMVTYVRKCRDTARAKLGAVGLHWDERGPDFWKMCKLEHGAPALSSDGLFYVTKKFGAPSTWAEFRHNVLLEDTLQAVPSLAKVRNNAATAGNLHAAIANAEKVGGAIPVPPRPST